jgi:hypothetical protein
MNILLPVVANEPVSIDGTFNANDAVTAKSEYDELIAFVANDELTEVSLLIECEELTAFCAKLEDTEVSELTE